MLALLALVRQDFSYNILLKRMLDRMPRVDALLRMLLHVVLVSGSCLQGICMAKCSGRVALAVLYPGQPAACTSCRTGGYLTGRNGVGLLSGFTYDYIHFVKLHNRG